MCGIAGYAGRSPGYLPDPARLHRMCETIRHRGPDEEGTGVVGPVALGMRRLSVIDVAGGAQPICNEDGSIRVTFNGEIYNYRELRRELAALGHRFRTRCDTEVIVHAYEQYGDGFASRLNGMFALALHDARERRLLLVRDHLGIKPLFYGLTEEALVWGSEIKAILASGLLNVSLDPASVVELCSWEYVPGEATLFKEIHKLPAGHVLELDAGGRLRGPAAYWDIPLEEGGSGASEDEWLARLDASVTSAVRRQLVSDVPLGAFLSGGVDSSVVAAAMGEAQTFSIGFDDPTYNELDYSREVAAHLGTRHVTRVLEPDVVEHFDLLMHHMDDPIADFSIFPTFLLSRMAREHVTVCLSGDGGDEVFGGYETYVAQRLAERYERVPSMVRALIGAGASAVPPSPKKKGLVNKIKRFVEGCERQPSLGHARWRLFLSDVLSESLFTPELRESVTRPAGLHIEQLAQRASALDDVSRSLYVDAKSYLVDNCLVKVDRMSMAVSLEVRVPLLDVELVELAFAMPSSLKVRNFESKYLLKRLAARKVPPRCVYRAKEGFSIPIKAWLAGQFRPLLEFYTSEELLRREEVFDANVVQQLKAEHLSGRANHSHILWSLIVFNAWRERWLPT